MGTGDRFQARGIEVTYHDRLPEDEPHEPVVLLHCVNADPETAWRAAGWDDALLGRGRRVLELTVAGASERSAESAQAHPAAVASAVVDCMDHADVACADLLCYGLGAHVGLFLLQRHQARIGAAVLGGVGDRLLANGEDDEGTAGLAGPTWRPAELGRVGTPVLVAAGETDEVVGDPVALAAAFGNAEAAVVPAATHRSTIDSVDFRAAATDFLERKGR